jgi:hypothetical protein
VAREARVANSETAKWHWAEGNKYALEAAKALLYLNGGAAIAILTFVGNHRPDSALIASTCVFAVGALAAAFIFMFAYMAQLSYGNAELDVPSSYQAALLGHKATYYAMGVSAGLFLLGMLVAAFGIGGH